AAAGCLSKEKSQFLPSHSVFEEPGIPGRGGMDRRNLVSAVEGAAISVAQNRGAIRSPAQADGGLTVHWEPMGNETIGMVVRAAGRTGVLHQLTGVIAQHEGDIT